MSINKKIPMVKEHLVIIRSGGSVLDSRSYNCQEIGLAKALSKKGLCVTVIIAGVDNQEEVIEDDGIEITIIYRRFKALNQALAWFDDMGTLLSLLKPTLIQVHEVGMLMSWRVVWWSKHHNIPVFLIQGSYEMTRKPIFNRLEHLFNLTFGKYILKHVAGIGVKNFRAVSFLKKYTSRNTILTPIGLDSSKFNMCENYDWKKELEIPSDAKILLYVGVFTERRHPLMSVEILNLLPKNCYLIMAGTGELHNATFRRARELGIAHRLRMPGQLPQVNLPSLYQTADLFILPSDYEIYGMVILESMYFGLPVVASSTAGSKLLISDGIDGYIVETLSAESFAETINKALYNIDPAIQKEMREAAMSKITSRYLWDKTADSFMRLYGLEV